MKNFVSILFLSILLSCASNRPIEAYMEEEIKENNYNNVSSILIDKKRSEMSALDIYIGKNIGGKIFSRAKSFDERDFEDLNNKYQKDTLTKYWKTSDSKFFNFSSMILEKEVWNYPLQNNDSTIYLYHLSKPLYLKRKKHAMFSLLKSKGSRRIVEDCVIIMKKEKGKWVMLEKVYATSLH